VLLDGAVIAEGSTIGATRIHLVGSRRARRLEIELTGEEPRLAAVSVHRTGVAQVEQVPDGYFAPADAPD
jgi:hypothetical protein